jgi:small ligand-binding sensory domain FIST
LTESDWSFDAPAAAVLILCDDIGLVRPNQSKARLTLTTTEAAPRRWLDDITPRLGLLSTGSEDDQPGRVWQRGRLVEDGLCEMCFAKADVAVGVSRGLRALTGSMTVTETDGLEIFGLDGEPALAVLLQHLPSGRRHAEDLPLSHLFAAVTARSVAADEAMAQGNYHLLPILAASHEEQSLTLALPLMAGDCLFWVLRQPAAAEQDSRQTVAELATTMPTPDFALMLACIGRGPYYFGGEDRDLAVMRERFPGLPIIGAYGSGEIAPLPAGNALISYSAVMALVSHVQS